KYEGATFAIIDVDEFREVPVLCKKNFELKDCVVKLRAGACYVRRRGRIETSEIPTQAEMRELLELATEKRLRSFLRQAQGAGLSVKAEASYADRFEAELGDFETEPIADKIKSRGCWRVTIRPTEYLPNRIASISDLNPLAQRLAVGIREWGWDFPYVDMNL